MLTTENVSKDLEKWNTRAEGAPQKKRGSGTSLSKAEGSRGEVSLLSTNPAPRRARDNQTQQGFCLSSSVYYRKLLIYIGKQGGFVRDFL